MSSKVIPDELVMSKIYLSRGQKVMIDRDLAELYGVETKVLKQAVRRNLKRFPSDFMFELSKEEFADLRSQTVTSSWGGSRYVPMAFTEHGVLMLSSVLRSDRAIELNIQIVRIFTKMIEMLLTHKDLLIKLENLESTVSSNSDQLVVLFEHLKRLLEQSMLKQDQVERKKIGFKKA